VTVPWPFPGDTELDKARRIAQDYRRELARLDPDLCARMDDAARRLGQRWIAPDHTTLDLEAKYPAVQMVTYLAGDVTYDQLRKWGSRGKIPRYHDDNGHTVYRVGDILDHLADQRRARAERVT
jgi:hypothetical protein